MHRVKLQQPLMTSCTMQRWLRISLCASLAAIFGLTIARAQMNDSGDLCNL